VAENTGISWAHNTWNPWVGCDKVAAECAHCYINRDIRKQTDWQTHELRKPWGEIYRTSPQKWFEPRKWEGAAKTENVARRVFTCSLSDFFHVKADDWREEAWAIIKNTPHLVWLVLTKRPERIAKHLPEDWGDGYPNVWLGVSTGCNQTLNKMDTLRQIPAAVRWISSEPLLEDISEKINLDGFHWVVTGGESGSGDEYLWNPEEKFTYDFERSGRRTMMLKWAENLRDKTKAAGLPFLFKQVTSPNSGVGVNAIGDDCHEFPDAPNGLQWAPRVEVEAKNKYSLVQIQELRALQDTVAPVQPLPYPKRGAKDAGAQPPQPTASETHSPAAPAQLANRYIVKSKSRYFKVKNNDGSPFTGWSWNAEIFRSTRKADATAFSSPELAFEVKAGICSSCLVNRPYWPHQIAVINVETGEEVKGYTEWRAASHEAAGAKGRVTCCTAS